MATPVSSQVSPLSAPATAAASPSERSNDSGSGLDFNAVLERSRVELEKSRQQPASAASDAKSSLDGNATRDALAAALAAMLFGQQPLASTASTTSTASPADQAATDPAAAPDGSAIAAETAATAVALAGTAASTNTLPSTALGQAADGASGNQRHDVTGLPLGTETKGNPAARAAAAEPGALDSSPPPSGQIRAEDEWLPQAVADRSASAPGAEASAPGADAKPQTGAPVPMPLATAPGFVTGTSPQAPAAAAPAAPALAVAPPIDSPAWGHALGQQLLRLDNGQHVAELRLNPEHLGPLTVTLTLGDKEAQIQFVSAHASVRQAIETALPDLKATLASSGISLGQTSVSAESQQQPRQDFELAAELFAGASRASVQAGRRAVAQPAGRIEEATRPQSRAGSTVDTFV